MDFFNFLDHCIEVITNPEAQVEIPPEIQEFLTLELDNPEYPFLFSDYFFNREDLTKRKSALTFFNRSLTKMLRTYNEDQIDQIRGILERFVQVKDNEILSLLPRTIVNVHLASKKQWNGFYKILGLYQDDGGYYRLCADCLLILLASQEVSQEYQTVLREFGPNLVRLGLFSSNVSDFFSAFRILLSLPIESEMVSCYEYVYKVAMESLEKFNYIQFRRFWARLSKLKTDPSNQVFPCLKFVEVAFVFLNQDIDNDLKESLLFYLCYNVNVLSQEYTLMLMKTYIKLLKNTEEHDSVLMQHFYYTCTPDQFKYSLLFFTYKIKKFLEKDNVQVASFLLKDILDYQPNVLIPYLESFLMPIIEKMILQLFDVYSLFTSFITSPICNSIDYYNFFNRIFVLLSTSPYEIRTKCYEIIISYGKNMNSLSGWLFPVLIQNINDIPNDDILFYLECIFSTFNPSLTFSNEHMDKLFNFVQSLLSNSDENIYIKAACFVFKLMIMHNDKFSPLFPMSLEIIQANTYNNNCYEALNNYIQYFGVQYIENMVPSIFDEAHDYLNNPARFKCAATLIKRCPNVLALPQTDAFISAVVEGELEFGNAMHLEMMSHLRFGKYFIRFFALINQKVRMVNMYRKDLVLGYCKIIRKMVQHINEEAPLENIVRCVDITFEYVFNSIQQMNHDAPNSYDLAQHCDILVELGIAMSILHIEKVHLVINIVFQFAQTGDYDILLNAMKLIEHCIRNQTINAEEIVSAYNLANMVMGNVRIDAHLTQMFNMILVFPQQVVQHFWNSLISFWSNLRTSDNFPSAKSILAAILCKYMCTFDNLFLPSIALECIAEFPPTERRQTTDFLQSILKFMSNKYPTEIRARAAQKIQTYLMWNSNRTKFYKVSIEFDNYIVKHFEKPS